AALMCAMLALTVSRRKLAPSQVPFRILTSPEFQPRSVLKFSANMSRCWPRYGAICRFRLRAYLDRFCIGTSYERTNLLGHYSRSGRTNLPPGTNRKHGLANETAHILDSDR